MPTPILTTERLAFHPFTAEDLPLLLALHGDAEVQRYMGGTSDEATARRRLAHYMAEQAERGHGKWKVSLHDGAFVGPAGVSWWAPTGELELGYALERRFWGIGLASEAAAALARWAFEHTDASHLIGFTRPDNLASRRVLEKIGMRFVDERDVGAGSLSAVYRLDRPAD